MVGVVRNQSEVLVASGSICCDWGVQVVEVDVRNWVCPVATVESYHDLPPRAGPIRLKPSLEVQLVGVVRNQSEVPAKSICCETAYAASLRVFQCCSIVDVISNGLLPSHFSAIYY